MSEVPHWLQTGGADGRILADFAQIVGARDSDGMPKYAPHSVCEPLARYLAGRGASAKRDAPLYELCQLIRAVDAAGRGADRLWLFFLGQPRPSANGCRAMLEAALADGGWSRPGFAATEGGLEISYADGGFSINYGRMPFLIALYEFMLGMEDFACAEEVIAIAEGLAAGPAEEATVSQGTNALARLMRRYRGEHLNYARHQETFDAILGFVGVGVGDGAEAVFDDETILAFWRVHNEARFRLYATVFDAFVGFARSMAANGLRRAAQMAESLDEWSVDDDSDVENDGQDAFEVGEWQSPLPLLDQEPACRIRFLLQSSERRPLEALMETGPYARRLPLAFLRREIFGGVQSSISNDLRLGREGDALRSRLDCSEAESYAKRRRRLEALEQRLRSLQLASLHALLSGTRDLPDEPLAALTAEQRNALLADCAKAFRKMTRKGFESVAADDAAHREGFRIGADVLRRTGQQVDGFLTVLQRLDGAADGLAARFAADREVFAGEFGKLYGGGHGTV